MLVYSAISEIFALEKVIVYFSPLRSWPTHDLSENIKQFLSDNTSNYIMMHKFEDVGTLKYDLLKSSKIKGHGAK